MSTVHLDWQPVIPLKVVRVPFGGMGGLSLFKSTYFPTSKDG